LASIGAKTRQWPAYLQRRTAGDLPRRASPAVDLLRQSEVMIKWAGDKTEMTTLATEWRLLHALRSPRFAGPIDYRRVGDDAAWMTTTRQDARPLTEYAGGDAWSLLQILAESLEGLSVLHRAGYVHGDVRPQNLLVSRRADGFDVVWVDLEHAVPSGQLTAGFGFVAGWNAASLDLGEPQSGRTDLAALGRLFGEFLQQSKPGAGARPEHRACLEQVITELTTESPERALLDAGEAGIRLRELCGAHQIELPVGHPDIGPAMYIANRTAERAWDEAWPRWCRAGRPLVVWVSGPPGCGKSSFLRGAAARAAEAGHVVLDLLPRSTAPAKVPDWSLLAAEIESSAGVMLILLSPRLLESFMADMPEGARPGVIVVVEGQHRQTRTVAVPASWQSEDFEFPPFTAREWLQWVNASF
jgi:hypothetical protein